MNEGERGTSLLKVIFTDWFLQHTNVCVWQDGAEGAWLNESPTGGDEQAAANHIAYGHAANDDWRAEGKGECGQAGSLLKAQVGSLLRSRRVHESVCVCVGSGSKQKNEDNEL